MTREEAISNVKGYLTDYLPYDDYEEVEEIIKALEQEPTTKNDLGVDCIDRDSAIKALDYDIKCFEFKSGVSKHMDDIAKLLNTIYETQVNNIKVLPSVTPIRPKGRWIWVFDETPSTPNSPYEVNYAGWVCSCCHKFPDDICEWDDPDEPPTYKFCPNCGSDNREVEG